jgi:hypothetical protein
MILLLMTFFAPLALSASPPSVNVEGFTESRRNESGSETYERFKKDSSNTDSIIGSAKQSYKKFTDRIRVPGFISATPNAEIAKLIGPSNLTDSFRIGDTLYFRWTGAPGPREGDRYATFSPSIVYQSLSDPTEFSIRDRPERFRELPDNFRLAGYFYEATGVIRVTKVSLNLVEAVLEGLSGQIVIGSEIMPLLPLREYIEPITGGLQLAAAVVAGSPSDRISSTKRSFIYINRGARDGIRVGRIFQAVESVKLDGAVSGLASEVSAGEAMVVHVTDSYSTAMITKQFDVIRIGSLLKTKQEFQNITPKAPFHKLSKERVREYDAPTDVEIPSLQDMQDKQDQSLPDPLMNAPEPISEDPLSELDALERSLNLKSLSEDEKKRLGRLSRQEKLEGQKIEAPDLGTLENSFELGAPKKKRASKKKKKSTSDEEELNQLMMQN